MNLLYFLIIFVLPFLILRDIKHIFFWIYLWQLKNYKVFRFLDHFKTEKGKKLIFNPIQIAKICLAVIIFFIANTAGNFYSAFLLLLLLSIYVFESYSYVGAIISRRAKGPEWTKKALFLTLVSFSLLNLYIFSVSFFAKNILWFCLLVLVSDILLPLVISIIVLFLQPITGLVRIKIIKRAKNKISSFKNLTVIGITGSYGKTTTKDFLKTILSEKFNVLATNEHQNSEMGITQSIFKELNDNHQIFIAEMGAYDKGGIKTICDLIKPRIGIVTGVNEQHLALFRTMERLLSAEGGLELLAALSRYNRGTSTLSGLNNGLILVNGENEYCNNLYNQAKIKKIAYYYKNLENLEIKRDSISFLLSGQKVSAKILGKHNVLNLLAAIHTAKELGMNNEEIIRGIAKITEKQSAFTILKSKSGINIIDSTYSANPDGVMADLDYLKLFPGKKIIIMPCLIELGKEARTVHEKIGQKIAEVCQFAVITAEEYFKEIKNGAISNNMQTENLISSEDANFIAEKIGFFAKADDSILLEGRISESIINKIKEI